MMTTKSATPTYEIATTAAGTSSEASRLVVGERAHEGGVPQRSRNRCAHVQSAEVVPLRDHPPEPQRPGRRRQRGGPPEEVDDELLAQDDRQCEVDLCHQRDRSEVRALAAPPVTARQGIPEHCHVHRHHENDQAVVMHDAGVFEDSLHQPRPRRQRDGVTTRSGIRKRDVAYPAHLRQLLGRRLRMLHHLAEALFIEAQHLHPADGSHRRIAWLGCEQTYFAEILAGRERADVDVAALAPLDDLDLARRDDVEAIGPLTLGHDDITASVPDPLQPAGRLAEERNGRLREGLNQPLGVTVGPLEPAEQDLEPRVWPARLRGAARFRHGSPAGPR